MSDVQSQVRCPLCDATDGFVPEPRTSPFARCVCGMVFNAAPTIPEDYQGDYFTREDPDSGHRDFASEWSLTYDRRRFAHELDRIIGRPISGGRLLDVGSATGSFLSVASEFGWPGVGVEISDYAREIASTAGVDCVATLDDLSPEEAFPVITMHHVLEHLEAPVAVLEQCRDRLAGGGRLVVEVPNYRSLERRAMQGQWSDLRPTQHRWQFEPATLRRILQRAGFRPETIMTLGEPIHTLRSIARTFGIPTHEVIGLDTTGQGHEASPPPANNNWKTSVATRLGGVADTVVNRAQLGKRLVAVAVAA